VGEGEGGRSLLGVVAVSLALLWTVGAAEWDTFVVSVVQDFEGVADDRNDRRGDFV